MHVYENKDSEAKQKTCKRKTGRERGREREESRQTVYITWVSVNPQRDTFTPLKISKT